MSIELDLTEEEKKMKKAAFKFCEFRVKRYSGDWVPTSGYVLDKYIAIHKEEEHYTIDHLPTGYAIAKVNTLKNAKAAALKLQPLDWKLTSLKSKKLKALAQHVHKIMAPYGGRGQ